MIRILLLITSVFLIISCKQRDSLEQILSKADKASNNERYEEALDLYQQAYDIDTTCVRALIGIADTELDLGQPDYGVEIYKLALEYKPKDVDRKRVYFNIAMVHKFLNENDSVLYYYQKAIEIDAKNRFTPSNDQIWNEIGNFHLENGEGISAINSYNQAIKINPNNAETYYLIGHTHQINGYHDRALPFFDEAIRKDSINQVYIDAKSISEKALKE